MKLKRKHYQYLIVLGLLAAATLIIWLAGHRVRVSYADQMQEAAALHRQVVAAVKEERLRRGYPLVPEDTLQIGLMGEHITAITTSLGAMEAKRTAQIPDFAALCVRLFREAGLKAGDRVGACFSGSFPGLDLAVLCAAKVMDLDIVYFCTLGASNYGANLPGYVMPEMVQTAVRAGLLSVMPSTVSMGGSGDRGSNMQGYALEETPFASAFAGYKDWFIQDFDRPGYTIEVGSGQNPLPLTQFDKIYSDNLGILTLGLQL